MNILHLKHLGSENISLHKPQPNGDNGVLSQNAIAVTPYRPNWLFYCLFLGKNPSYLNFINIKCLPSHDGVILQNKPMGEYAERLLLQPRVNPITFFKVFSQTQNAIGA